MTSAPKISKGINLDEARLLPRYRQPGTNTPTVSQQHGTLNTPARSANTGNVPTATPAELRGIPCIARGVGGTVTDPNLKRILRNLDDWSPHQ